MECHGDDQGGTCLRSQAEFTQPRQIVESRFRMSIFSVCPVSLNHEFPALMKVPLTSPLTTGSGLPGLADRIRDGGNNT